MSVLFVVLNKTQLKNYERAITQKHAFELRLNKKQVQNASVEPIQDSVPLGLTRVQMRKYEKAKQDMKPLVLSFSKTQMSKRGGFFGAIIPALAAMAPGLLGAAPGIFEGIKSGFENFGKLLGIKPAGSGLVSETKGDGLSIHGGDLAKLEKFVEGSSLRIFGEGKDQKKAMMPNPSEIRY